MSVIATKKKKSTNMPHLFGLTFCVDTTQHRRVHLSEKKYKNPKEKKF